MAEVVFFGARIGNFLHVRSPRFLHCAPLFYLCAKLIAKLSRKKASPHVSRQQRQRENCAESRSIGGSLVTSLATPVHRAHYRNAPGFLMELVAATLFRVGFSALKARHDEPFRETRNRKLILFLSRRAFSYRSSGDCVTQHSSNSFLFVFIEPTSRSLRLDTHE